MAKARVLTRSELAEHLGVDKQMVTNPNRKIFEARKRETAALGAGEKLVLGHPLAATIGDSARWSSLNFPVKSPYGSPRSVKLLTPPTCLAGEARCEAPRLS